MMDSKPAAIRADSAFTSVDAPVPTMNRSLQPRLGSLPFKKRRLFDATTSSSSLDEPQGEYLDPFELRDDDKFAALALVAVAASVAQIPRSVSDLAPSDEEHRATPVNIYQLRTDMNDLVTSAMSPFKTNVVTPEVVHPTKELVMSPQGGAVSKPGSRRIHHPPLLTPLPNGCHGRTSRNHSYCRRTPCFNGSQYCKLHYQQYVISGMRAPDESMASFDADEQASTTSSSADASAVTFQDRRYTGAEEEQRCSAITTRGRACAYIAVNDTSFCFLHSDYANNPPPRRGGGLSTAMLMQQAGLLNSDSEQDTPKRPLVPRTITKKTARSRLSPPSVSSEESGRGGATVSGPADSSSYPMLSSISSDLWYDRKVLITTGPLVNRMGRVSKWGNGWVTCQVLSSDGAIAEGLLHNRRSVELLLVPEDHMPSDSETGGEEEEEHQGAALEGPDGQTLARCVSGEIGPSSISSKETVAADSHVTQGDLSACVSADEKENAGEFRSMTDASEPKSKVALDAEGASEKRMLEYAQDARSPSPQLEPPGDNTMADEHSQERLAELLVEEGRGRKHSLDLLFGTAALDRSRRTISRPSRYEDTAMLEKGKAPKSPR